MSEWSKRLAAVFSLTLVWGSYEMYYQMRAAEALSLEALGFAVMSVACMVVAVLIARTAGDTT